MGRIYLVYPRGLYVHIVKKWRQTGEGGAFVPRGNTVRDKGNRQGRILKIFYLFGSGSNSFLYFVSGPGSDSGSGQTVYCYYSIAVYTVCIQKKLIEQFII